MRSLASWATSMPLLLISLIGLATIGLVIFIVVRAVGRVCPTGLGRAVRRVIKHRQCVTALRNQQGVPIEKLAADLRRLRRLIATERTVSAARHLGRRMAYDRLLVQSCAMLDLGHELDADSSGLTRDIERLRVEAELERAGFVLTTDYGRAA